MFVCVCMRPSGRKHISGCDKSVAYNNNERDYSDNSLVRFIIQFLYFLSDNFFILSLVKSHVR
ncbi:hypothetical protein AALO_G00258970 [Alosa alosa]|uniref:Uncharacterized protein n=1 Tax=Alosa alosa TaxID=278164 RepID=A0AAV6FSX7_9TELE|nr:hypothetical protein AALO_G00258970 [Alosa alosa]